MFPVLPALLASALVAATAFAARGPAHCANRIRDALAMTYGYEKMAGLRVKLKAPIVSSHERAELHFRMAREAWMTDPVRCYETCEFHLQKALEANPLHVRARELALVHALRGLERGDVYALGAALSHAKELLIDPQIFKDPVRARTILRVVGWLEGKKQGREALQFIAATVASAEQVPRIFVHRTESLFMDFQMAVWETGDSLLEVLDGRILNGESSLEALEKGLELLGERYTALLLLDRANQAVTEYRALLDYLVVGIEPSLEHDGTFLIEPGLKLADKFAFFKADPDLVMWSADVMDRAAASPEDLHWADLFLAGHVMESPDKARFLWKAAARQYTRIHAPLALQSVASRTVQDHFKVLLSDEGSKP